jgi:GNAT superfamily N-acetyltransferase
MTIRLATPRDATTLVDLALAFRDHLGRSKPDDASFQEGITRILDSPDGEFALGFSGESAVGYALLRYRHSMWCAGTEATLEDLFVLPSSRGQGIGRDLVGFALERARTRGCASVCLDTNERNEASTRIYRAFGFDSLSPRWGARQIFYRLNLCS